VEFAARQGWLPEVAPAPAMPRFNAASIPGGGIGNKPVPYAANFSVARGGLPQLPAGVDDDVPPYDVDLSTDAPHG
jgi:hypothetical protein